MFLTFFNFGDYVRDFQIEALLDLDFIIFRIFEKNQLSFKNFILLFQLTSFLRRDLYQRDVAISLALDTLIELLVPIQILFELFFLPLCTHQNQFSDSNFFNYFCIIDFGGFCFSREFLSLHSLDSNIGHEIVFLLDQSFDIFRKLSYFLKEESFFMLFLRSC